MKLDNLKNILIYQKALYAEQLHYYSKLCELYLELSKFHKSITDPAEIEKIYAKPLSLAASGNLDPNEIIDFSRREQRIFKKYAFYSQKFNEFKQASDLLSEVFIYE